MAEMFGGAKPLGRAPRTIDDWRELVEMGIPEEALSHLRDAIASSPEQAATLAEVVFETAARRKIYFERYKSKTRTYKTTLKNTPGDKLAIRKLSGSESERAERIARLYTMAEEVLGSEREARDFLFAPHAKLDGHRPIDWMRTEIGGRNVEQLLLNIRESFPS
jgi:hypothetical protein